MHRFPKLFTCTLKQYVSGFGYVACSMSVYWQLSNLCKLYWNIGFIYTINVCPITWQSLVHFCLTELESWTLLWIKKSFQITSNDKEFIMAAQITTNSKTLLGTWFNRWIAIYLGKIQCWNWIIFGNFGFHRTWLRWIFFFFA